MRGFREDIQALRGLAVLLVVLNHARLGLFSSGYLGVDIFFVISGFLITGLVRDGIEAGKFRATDFYFRRAKRILPAAYTTIGITALLAPFFLAGFELKQFVSQVYGAITFTANFVLWRQSGYFANAAELKPLLHVWSLSVEEQYYFILPLLMMATPKRSWLPLAIMIFSGSLALRIVMGGHPDAAFYLFPTRAWELTIGSVGALIPSFAGARGRLLQYSFWPSVLALVLVPASGAGLAQPVASLLAVCIATLAVLLCRREWLFKAPGLSALARVGDMSYSLYLVHWPLFSFFANAWVSGSAWTAILSHIALVFASLAIAHVLYRYVEAPMHHWPVQFRSTFVAGLVMASVALVALAFGLGRYAASDAEQAASARRPNYGLDASCDFTTDFQPVTQCRNSASPKYLLWGDSYAMAIVPGLLAGEPARALVQATRSVCGPILGVAFFDDARYDRNWAQSCIRFSDSVFEYLKRTEGIETVVLTSRFDNFFEGRVMVRDGQGRLGVVRFDSEKAADAFLQTIARLREIGKKVVVVAPPPRAPFDVARCVERIKESLPVIQKAPGCTISAPEYRRNNADLEDFLGRVRTRADAAFVDLPAMLCGRETCRTIMDGIALYRDAGHLSYEGSRIIFTHFPAARVP